MGDLSSWIVGSSKHVFFVYNKGSVVWSTTPSKEDDMLKVEIFGHVKCRTSKRTIYIEKNGPTLEYMKRRFIDEEMSRGCYDSDSHFKNYIKNACTEYDNYWKPSTYTLNSGHSFNVNSGQILQSMLQKAIRRRLPETAIAAAIELVRINGSSLLLRRLPIIMIEDCSMFPEELCKLVWLMIAMTRGYKLNDVCLRHEILPIIYKLAQSYYLDIEVRKSHTDVLVTEKDIEKFGDEVIEGCPNIKKVDVLLSILTRLDYGGMPGDMRLFKGALYTWYKRFLQPPEIYTRYINVYKHDDLDDTFFKKLDNKQLLCTENCIEEKYEGLNLPVCNVRLHNYTLWIPEAIDFHCTNVIEYILNNPRYLNMFEPAFLQEYIAEDTSCLGNVIKKEIIKKCLWNYRSSFTVKHNT